MSQGCNLFATNASNYIDIINNYYMFSGLNFSVIDLKWKNNVTNEYNDKIGVLNVLDMIHIYGFKHYDVLDKIKWNK